MLMARSMQETYRRRLLLVASFLMLFATLVLLRLVQYQVVDHDDMRAAAIAMHSKTTVIPARRGTIFDRNGHILATSLREDVVVGDPGFFKNRSPREQERIVSTTASILGMPADQILAKLSGPGGYVKIKEGVPLTVTKALRDADLSMAITSEPAMRRVYPSGALAASTIGFVNAGGDGIGLEWGLNEALAGLPGEKLYEPYDYGDGPARVPIINPAQDGATVTLTLDLYIQYKVERELETALAAEKTITGSILVMNPKTGEVLALAGRPTFDLNRYSVVPHKDVYLNQIVAAAWEPASIFKILTVAAALDAGKITPEQKFYDGGVMKYHGVEISNRNKVRYGSITPAQILQHSSNVGTVQVASALGLTGFYTYTHAAFGIGMKTGIDLPNESAGMLRLPGDPYWHVVDLAVHSYGQGLTATPIQMASAVAAIANRGIMMRPHIVADVSGRSDQTLEGPAPLRRVIKSETADAVTAMLVSVTETTVKQARVPGYRLAGKTGTGLVPTATGSYADDQTIASFIGYGPAEDPQFLILVRIDNPRVNELGADAAAPVFRNIAQWLLAYLKIPPAQQVQR